MAGQESGRRHRWRASVPVLALVMRLALAAAMILASWVSGVFFVAAPWAVAVAVADLLLFVLLRWRAGPHTIWKVLGVTAIALLATAGAQVIPERLGVLLNTGAAVLGGLVLGLRGALVVAACFVAGSLLMIELTAHHGLHGLDVVAVLASVSAAGLISAIWHERAPQANTAAAREARKLLVRLSSLAESLDTGFDLPSLGDTTLEEVAEQIDLERAALIVRNGKHPVPISLLGLSRLPWAAPSHPESQLHRTWSEGIAIRRAYENESERWFLLTMPLHDSQGELLGLIAMDRQETPYSSAEEAALAQIALGTGPLLEVAILFSGLRTRAALEERSRLARDMHDGVAQELAALSYSVDTLLSQAAHGQDVTSGLRWLRQSMRQSLGDIRHQISTLRMVERPDVSLGSVLSTNLRNAGTNSGMRTTMSIEETPFRFPAHIEVSLNRLALDVLADARAGGATMFDMEVALSAPNARLAMRHDGRSGLDSTSFDHHPAAAHGEILVERLLPTGRYVEIVLGSDPAPTDDSFEIEDIVSHLQLAEATDGDVSPSRRSFDQEAHA
ncbi:MAG: hypothetical protein GX344_12520 [Intrasporangiaceae bacterium]|nr:hypothetical protein [Intrasporangiaceae bacterium]